MFESRRIVAILLTYVLLSPFGCDGGDEPNPGPTPPLEVSMPQQVVVSPDNADDTYNVQWTTQLNDFEKNHTLRADTSVLQYITCPTSSSCVAPWEAQAGQAPSSEAQTVDGTLTQWVYACRAGVASTLTEDSGIKYKAIRTAVKAKLGIDIPKEPSAVIEFVNKVFTDSDCGSTDLLYWRNIHVAQFTAPKNSIVKYRICSQFCDTSEGKYSNTQTFRTPDDRGIQCLMGDMGNYNNQLIQALTSAVTTDVLHPRCSIGINAGDMAYNAFTSNFNGTDELTILRNTGSNGDEYMNLVSAYQAVSPWLQTPGNHEKAFRFSHFIFRLPLPIPYPDDPSNPTNSLTDISADSLLTDPTQNVRNSWFFCKKNNLVMNCFVNSELYFSALGINPAEDPSIQAAQYSNLFGTNTIDRNLLGEQFDFINKTLRAVDRTETPWVVVTTHQPFYCSSNTPFCNEQSQRIRQGLSCSGRDCASDFYYALLPLFEELNVDIIFNSHVHNTEISYPTWFDADAPTPPANETYREGCSFGAEVGFDRPAGPIPMVFGAAGNAEGLEEFLNPCIKRVFTRMERYSYGTFEAVNATNAVVRVFYLDQVGYTENNLKQAFKEKTFEINNPTHNFATNRAYHEGEGRSSVCYNSDDSDLCADPNDKLIPILQDTCAMSNSQFWIPNMLECVNSCVLNISGQPGPHLEFDLEQAFTNSASILKDQCKIEIDPKLNGTMILMSAEQQGWPYVCATNCDLTKTISQGTCSCTEILEAGLLGISLSTAPQIEALPPSQRRMLMEIFNSFQSSPAR